MKKIGILASSGGATFRKSVEILIESGYYCEFSFMVVTDRECGIEQVAEEFGIPHMRIHYSNKSEFSTLCCNAFQKNFNPDAIVLFFTRIIGEELFNEIPCVNLHPSLLPAFTGFDAIERASAYGVRFLGATLHNVDGTVDLGKIIAQVIAPLQRNMDIKQYYEISHLQILYLLLLFYEYLWKDLLIKENKLFLLPPDYQYNLSCNPCILDENLKKYFQIYQIEKGIKAIG